MFSILHDFSQLEYSTNRKNYMGGAQNKNFAQISEY